MTTATDAPEASEDSEETKADNPSEEPDEGLPEWILRLKPVVASGDMLKSDYDRIAARYQKKHAGKSGGPLLAVEQYQDCLFTLGNPRASQRQVTATVGPVVREMMQQPKSRLRHQIEVFALKQRDVAANLPPPERPKAKRRALTDEEKKVLSDRIAKARETRAAKRAAKAAAGDTAQSQPATPGDGRRRGRRSA